MSISERSPSGSPLRPSRQPSPPRALSSESAKDRVSASFFNDPSAAAVQLMGLVGGIDKAHWALSDPDPVQLVLEATIRYAPGEFWSALAQIDIKPMVARVRNWLLAMIKAKRKDQTGAGLKFLTQLDLSSETIAQIKLKPVLRVLRRSLVGKDALLLASKYGLELDDQSKENEPKSGAITTHDSGPSAPENATEGPSNRLNGSAQAAPSASPKSELEIPKRQARQSFQSLLLLNKRGREDFTDEQTTKKPKSAGSSASTTPSHRAAPRKKVQWKDDEELLRVCYYDIENAPTVLSAEYIEPHGRLHGGPDLYAPRDFTIEYEDSRIAKQMGIKRGGKLVPDYPPTEPGMPFVLASSPHEPEHQTYTNAPPVKMIPKFEQAQPIATQDIQKLLGSFVR